MKRPLLSVLFVLFLIGGLQAQRGRGLVDKSDESTSYLTLSVGPSFCFSDTKLIAYTEPLLKNFDLSIGYRKLFSNNFAYKIAYSYNNYTGRDTISTSSTRFYSFSTSVMQLGINVEYFIKIGREYYYKPTPNAIYLFLGAGVLRSKANLSQNEPRGDYDYKINKYNYAPVIPFGFGYQYNFNNKFLLGAEVNWKLPLSDYIDGFSPPYPESKSNDILSTFSVTFTYLLGFEYLKRN